MKTLQILAAVIVAMFTCVAAAQSGGPARAAARSASAKTVDRYLFGLSEGTSGGIDADVALEKYRPLANVIEKTLGRKVIVTFVRSFDALEAGMKKGEFDLVMARPSDYPARGVRDYKYNMVAASKPDGQCVFIVEKTSTLKTIADVKGKNIIFPEKIAYMSKFCTAELRDHDIDVNKEKITYAKEQGAVGWTIETRLSDVGGVASYSAVAKNWEKNGQRVLHKSIAEPYSPLIAGNRVAPEQIAKLKTALGDLDKTEEGRKVLSTLGIQGFNPESSERLLALLAWLEKPAS